MARTQTELNIHSLRSEYITLRACITPFFQFINKEIPFKNRIEIHYFYWCIQILDPIFSNPQYPDFPRLVKIFFDMNWQLVKGTMLCPTAFSNRLMIEFFIRLASIVDEKNPLKVLMPTINLVPVDRNFPLLQPLVLDEDEENDFNFMDELNSSIFPCSERLNKIIKQLEQDKENPQSKENLEQVQTLMHQTKNDIDHFDKDFNEARTAIKHEIQTLKKVTRETWERFALVINNTNIFLSSSFPIINETIELDCENHSTHLKHLSITCFPNCDALSIIGTHILCDDEQSLIPVSCLASEGFMTHPHETVYRPYDSNYGQITEWEFMRLTIHSERTRAFHAAVESAANSLNQDTRNLKTQLNILCRKLRQEDAHGGRGSQEQVGELAFVAITDFFEFYDSLTEEQKGPIPASLIEAIAKLREVSGQYRGNMSSLIETCAGSRREQIEHAMHGHDVLLAGISIDEKTHGAQIVQAIRVRDELKAELLDSLTRNAAGQVSYQEGFDTLPFNRHIFDTLHIPVAFELVNACKNNNLKLVQALTQICPEIVNQPNSQGQTPLTIACSEAHLNIVRYLLNVDGINVNQANGNGFTPLIIACLIDNTPIAQILLQATGIIVNQTDRNGITPLNIACKQNNHELLKNLLAIESINVNQADNQGTTPLLAACKQNKSKLVKSLLKMDAINVNQADNHGTTPLIMACKKNNLKIVQALLEIEGIDVNQADNEYFTPLMWACKNDNFEIVQALLEIEEININKINDADYTPLMFACENGNLEIVQALLRTEETEVENEDEDEDEDEDLIPMINQGNFDGKTALILACENGHLEIVQALLAADGIDVNQANDDNETPLFVACENGHLEIVQALLAAEGIDVNKTDASGASPLFPACENGHLEIVQALLAADGIDVNLADDDNTTPLMSACHASHPDIVRALLSVDGIDIHRANNENKTALDYALESNNREIQDLLSNREPPNKRFKF